MSDIIDEYFRLREKIYEYFDYTEDWCIIPLVDHRNYEWCLTGDGNGYNDSILFSQQKLTVDLVAKGNHYEASIYTQQFLSKWIYRGEKYTMVCMDTHMDENKYIGIFENEKEIKDENISSAAW